MNYWLIVNDAAGDGRRGESYWREHLQAAGIDEVQVRALSATDWEREVAPGDRLLAAGGDGSVNRVASVCIERHAVLGVLPSGTANDFARNLNLPEDPAALCRLVRSGQSVTVDVAWLNGHLFLNVAHIGLGTLPAKDASQAQKRRLGRFSYLLTLAQRIGLQSGIHGRIECNGQVVEGRWLTIAIASGAYFGGGHDIAEARIDDGLLDVVAVRQRSWLRLLVAFVMVRLLRRTPRHDDTVVHLQAPQCHVQLRNAHTLTADGENLGRMSNVSAFTQRGVLEVLCERPDPIQPSAPEAIRDMAPPSAEAP
ncbi:diacylglycerol kinase family protein [Halomonas sp. LR3S48]|uniref:diacylglycerol/lipid kinase family protein n=1 Tax=Halomonadaceae TaxID=28256 RepID=UPI0021E3BDA1|nr:diacylglycerol kinase family protein [Halomonas sp. LR3S48]UYG03071.1 diacylglycerol kinase family protein [Halomonas sp. LR3S48]